MKFKSDRIKEEYAQLSSKNPRLLVLLEQVVGICDRIGIDEPLLTCILRTPEENTACGGIECSPHLIWEGADLRSSIYTQDEIKDLLLEINKLPFKYGNKLTAIYHQVPGGAPHFHTQVKKEMYE